MPHRVIKSIDGRRGGVLFLIALAFICYGWAHLHPSDGRARLLAWMPEWVRNEHLGWALIAVALLALLCSLISKRSKHALAVGYTLAFAEAGVLGIIYGIAWSSGLTSDPAVSVLFLVIAALIFSIGGWDEERPHPPLTPAQKQVLLSPPEKPPGGGDDAA